MLSTTPPKNRPTAPYGFFRDRWLPAERSSPVTQGELAETVLAYLEQEALSSSATLADSLKATVKQRFQIKRS